jgi:DNA polymerase-3 subunit epsilon
MRPEARALRWGLLAALATALLALAWLALGWALLASTLAPAERAALAERLAPALPLLVLALLPLAGGAAALVQWGYRRWVAPPARLLEQAQVLLASDVQRELPGEGAAELRALAGVVNELARQRAQLRSDIAAQVAEASRGVEQERNRLAALMSELTQSVVVCNLDGRILLYNNRARLQFRALSAAPSVAAGAELIGLGRSIYTVFERRLVAHALDSVQQRLARGVPSPSAQFVTTTRAGQLLRVQMAPVRGAGDAGIAGFVLVLDNITRAYDEESARDRLLHGLTEGSRASLASLQAAVELLDDAQLDAATRERFLGIIRDETRALSARVQQVAAQAAQGLATRWPLEEMLGADLVAAAQRRIEAALGLRAAADEVDATLWLELDSFSLLQALTYLAERLRDEHGIRLLQLRLTPAAPGRAHLDLVWSGPAMSTETVMSWETDPIRVGGEASPLAVRDVVQRHGGEFWFERERVRHQAFFRFLLPLARAACELDAATFVRSDSRPEYYDFDLFALSESNHALDERALAELSYTVFDTETTGLDPAGGDKIIQIGAVRLVAGKLRKGEAFDQLVDPGRSIPAATIPIHGITPEMVAGAPTIATVLPAFHAYAQDSVLVAHNAAFDLRFLQLEEAATGCRFDQPVLDTLLLSALVHPNQASHKLEAIAERFGVSVIGRHTALGDAMVTAEIFQKLIPLLAERGIHTLGQARAAAQQTYYARVKY